MKIFIASDHTGFEIKEKVKDYLREKQYTFEDCGASDFNPDDDYPQFMHAAAQGVSENPDDDRGILLGGSGQGEAMVANKVKGIRCALFYAPAVASGAVDIEGNMSEDSFSIVRLTREHNGANMLSIGVRFLTEEQIIKAINLWLEASQPSNERHIRRIQQIKELES